MKKIFKKNLVPLLYLTILILPAVTYGASLIPCGDNVVNGVVTNPCGFNDILVLANNVIHFLMYDVAVPLAAIGFMFSGAKLILNQDKEGAWNEAKGAFGNILMGFVIILGSYVLIKVIIFNFLTTEQASFMQFILQ